MQAIQSPTLTSPGSTGHPTIFVGEGCLEGILPSISVNDKTIIKYLKTVDILWLIC